MTWLFADKEKQGVESCDQLFPLKLKYNKRVITLSLLNFKISSSSKIKKNKKTTNNYKMCF